MVYEPRFRASSLKVVAGDETIFNRMKKASQETTLKLFTFLRGDGTNPSRLSMGSFINQLTLF